ncbi:MAG: DNA photolyase [Coxiellaceae bacterium]|nr:DNA photolyase [Coxiellaceae bacterium]|tara:strand:+ start:1663 stop:2658 length:996 start_codon:yes stop_codon:yes gene_type:complete
MSVIYVESRVLNHPRTRTLLERIGQHKTIIECDHYREIFNRKSQSFRIQKQHPALILAEKPSSRVLPTPPGFGIGGQKNYYFSHLLNCPYDCRYCFLQGMYQSAHYVLFVNYEDFQSDIVTVLEEHQDEVVTFFSGYDSDSLAFNPNTQFIENFIPFFEKHPRALLELRTKSANVKSLLNCQPIQNAVVAFSMTPDSISRQVEHRVPKLSQRLKAMKQLQVAGWRIGLRFDPLIYTDNFQALYDQLLTDIFSSIDSSLVHSVSTGLLRFPEKMYQKITAMYPKDKLLAHPLEVNKKIVSYSKAREIDMLNSFHKKIAQYVPDTSIFKCSAD